MLIPMPALLLDILIILNLLFAFLICLLAFRVKNIQEFTSFPTVVLISIISNMAVTVSATRLILTKGEAFDVKLIGNIFILFANSDFKEIVIQFVILLSLSAIFIFFIFPPLSRLSHDISNEDSDCFISIQSAYEYIEQGFKVFLFIIWVIIIPGTFKNFIIEIESGADAILINIPFSNSITMQDNMKTFVPLAAGLGFFSILHFFLLSLSFYRVSSGNAGLNS